MQGDVDETSIVEDACGVDHFGTPAIGGFANGNLIFVDVANDIIGHGSLGDEATTHVCFPIIDGTHFSFLMRGCRIMGQPEKRAIAVGIVGADDASVDTGFLAYNEIRASL